MSRVRSWGQILVLTMVVACLGGCVQVGDFAGTSDEHCAARASNFETYLARETNIDRVTVIPSGNGSEGQCTIDVMIEAPASSSPQDLVSLAVIAFDAVRFGGYTPQETNLDITFGEETLAVLPPSRARNATEG